MNVAVLVFSAVSLGLLGFIAMAPTKASAAFACGVSSQSRSSGGTILSLTTGTSLVIGIPSGYGNGHWEADFGTFNPSGKYVAPEYVPATGVDALRYVTSTDVVTAIVHIAAPSGGAPAQPLIRYNLAPRYSPLWDDPTYRENLRHAFVNQPQNAVAVPLDYSEAPIEVTDCVEAQDTVEGLDPGAHNESGQLVAVSVEIPEATTTPTSRSAMRSPTWPLQPFPPRPLRCKPAPGHQPPPGYCTGPSFVPGKVTVDPPKDSTEPGSTITITVTASNKGSLIAKFPGFGLEIGGTYTLPITYYVTSWTCHQIVDYWKCVNGTWVFDHSEMCRQSKVDRKLPDWALHPVRIAPDPPSRPWQPPFPSCCGRMG